MLIQGSVRCVVIIHIIADTQSSREDKIKVFTSRLAVKEAEKNNCTIISGIEMFINQAAEQFKLWTGKKTDINLIRGLLK